MAKKKSYAAIGIRQFGASACGALVQAGQEVLTIDSSEEAVNESAGSAMRAVIVDAQDEDTLCDLDIGGFDHVYISIGENVKASIMATLIAKELGAPDVICRAESVNHARVLERIGADTVARPEHDLVKRPISQQLNPSAVDYVTLSKEITLTEVNINNPKFFNKTLDELDLCNRYNINVIIIVSKDDEVNQMPQANGVIQPHDKITVVGQLKDIRKLDDIVS